MCGIVAFVGHKPATPVILNGLKRLEYRGYDSAGIALLDPNENQIKVYKKQGKVKILENHIKKANLSPSLGIGHTRWATHGEPSDANAHPHISQSGRLCLVHNGIIENYGSIKKVLLDKGYTFLSETDTEVLVNFIEDILKHKGCSTEEAVRLALNEVVGAYAIVLIDNQNPGQLVAARKGSPLVIGIDGDDYYLASDATPIVEFTKEVVYLDDKEVALIKDGELSIVNLENQEKGAFIQTIEMELEAIEKGGYDHFMLKEIFEQPRSIADCMRGRISSAKGHIQLGGLEKHLDLLANANRIVLVACGTSWHACLVGEYLLEELARVNVEVEYASEFRYRNPIVNEGDIVLAVSQSGETADTLAALELAKSKGAIILGVCNVVGSSIARITEAGVYTHAGPEIGVASTKAFTAQVTVLSLIAITTARRKNTINEKDYLEILQELEAIPKKVEAIFKQEEAIKHISRLFTYASNFIFLGRGLNFPVALEGALKLKEISYIHAEGYPAAEMKHGPIALIDENMPVVFIATKDSSYEKVVSNLQEVKARKGRVVAIVSEGDTVVPDMVDFSIEIPETHELLLPLLTTIPLQLLSYYIAVYRGRNVDQPRNLAKSVTVE